MLACMAASNGLGGVVRCQAGKAQPPEYPSPLLGVKHSRGSVVKSVSFATSCFFLVGSFSQRLLVSSALRLSNISILGCHILGLSTHESSVEFS